LEQWEGKNLLFDTVNQKLLHEGKEVYLDQCYISFDCKMEFGIPQYIPFNVAGTIRDNRTCNFLANLYTYNYSHQ
jgi:hypothetical protein